MAAPPDKQYSAVPTEEGPNGELAAVTVGNPRDVELTQQPGAASQGKGEPAEVTLEHSRFAIPFAVALYASCSSTLLVINKVAMYMMPDASFVLFCQFLSSALAVRFLRCVRPDMDIELLTWAKVKPFAVATLVFYLCLLANTKALRVVNVETVIVARSLSPIAVALLDRLALGRQLPSLKGSIALLMIAGGAVLYVATDQGFRTSGYLWLGVYFVFIVIEMVFVKFVVDTVPMSTWTRVYYNNVLSLPLTVVSALLTGDVKVLQEREWSLGTAFAVALSCVVGVAISYAGFNLRELVSATSFTVVGVVCKILTILINDLIWTKHSNLLGHLSLLICIMAGFLYERSKAEQRRKQQGGG